MADHRIPHWSAGWMAGTTFQHHLLPEHSASGLTIMVEIGVTSKIRNALQRGGQMYGARLPFVIANRLVRFGFRKCFGPRTFDFAGKSYRYHLHPLVLNNERVVEVALGKDFVIGSSGAVLEVGNVLPNYCAFPHDVVDKYERSPGVVNEDIVTYNPGKKYDRIISISTIEHVGWDEQPKEPGKVALAINRLKELLKNDGQLLITLPLGYNPHVDRMVREEQTGLEVRFLLRISANNQWREATLAEVASAKFDSPFPCANALAIGFSGRKTS